MSDLSDLIHKITNNIREKYNYTDEQLMAYFQGMTDSAVESMESYNKQSKILNDTVEELVEALEGDIEPYAETHVDEKHYANIKEWVDIHDKMTRRLLDIANRDGLTCYYSANQIIQYAREHLEEIYNWIGSYLEEWDNENKS